MASPLPTLQYLVAFQNNAYDDPALIATVASPAGTLGANNVWTDITSFVMSHTFDRGRQHELSQFEAGKCDLVLNNRDGRFSPFNTTSPYNGFLTVRKLFQIRQTWSGTTYTRFTGLVDAWPIDWPDQTSQWCSLHVSDAFRALNLADITTAGYPAQIITDGAVGYWRLGDVVGSQTAADSSGNLRNGSPDATVTFGQAGALPADPGTGAQISDSATDGVFRGVQIPTFLGSQNNVTAETWYQSSSPGGMSLLFTVTMQSDATPIQFSFNINSAVGLQLVCGSGGGSSNQAETVGDGSWHHCAVTIASGAASSHQVATAIFYFDGVAVKTATNISTSTTAFNGTDGIYGQSGTGTAFNLQEVALFPSVLSAAAILAEFNLGSWGSQSTDARITKVLNSINWSSGARALDAGKSTMQKQTSSLVTTSALSHMQAVEGTEGGALFMTGDGKVKFLSRTTLQGNSLYTTSQATIGDHTAVNDMPFQPSPQLMLDDIDLFNEAIATRTGGNTQKTTNSTSITNNGRVTWTAPTTLLGTSDSEVLALTQYIVAKFATPVVRVQSVTVDLLELITPNLVANLLSLDLLYQVTVERTVTPDGGTAFSQTANIERIHEQVTPDSWQVTFQLAKADPGWWILGTSQLGTQTALAW